MIMVVELQTLPRILLHVDRRLNHVSVGVQEVAAHQQSELFWRFHLQNVPRRWIDLVHEISGSHSGAAADSSLLR
jgi:hypothetical protein